MTRGGAPHQAPQEQALDQLAARHRSPDGTGPSAGGRPSPACKRAPCNSARGRAGSCGKPRTASNASAAGRGTPGCPAVGSSARGRRHWVAPSRGRCRDSEDTCSGDSSHRGRGRPASQPAADPLRPARGPELGGPPAPQAHPDAGDGRPPVRPLRPAPGRSWRARPAGAGLSASAVEDVWPAGYDANASRTSRATRHKERVPYPVVRGHPWPGSGRPLGHEAAESGQVAVGDFARGLGLAHGSCGATASASQRRAHPFGSHPAETSASWLALAGRPDASGRFPPAVLHCVRPLLWPRLGLPGRARPISLACDQVVELAQGEPGRRQIERHPLNWCRGPLPVDRAPCPSRSTRGHAHPARPGCFAMPRGPGGRPAGRAGHSGTGRMGQLRSRGSLAEAAVLGQGTSFRLCSSRYTRTLPMRLCGMSPRFDTSAGRFVVPCPNRLPARSFAPSPSWSPLGCPQLDSVALGVARAVRSGRAAASLIPRPGRSPVCRSDLRWPSRAKVRDPEAVLPVGRRP